MAGKKKSKKDKKAAKKTKKEARKAEERAAAAAKASKKAPPKAVTQTAKKAAPKVAKSAAKKPAKKKPAARRTPRPALHARQQPESLRLRSAGPSFTVNDIQKSLAFYRDVLGFRLKERWEQDGALHGVEMVAGSVTFWLGQDDWKKGRDRVKGQGFRMYCGTTQDVDALVQRIKAAGGTLTEEPKDQPWGGRAFALVDPDGFAITVATRL